MARSRRKRAPTSRLRQEVLGILMAATGGFLMIALWPYDPALGWSGSIDNRVGLVGVFSARYLYQWLGFGAPMLGAIITVWGGLVFFRGTDRRRAIGTAALVLATFFVITLLGVVDRWNGDPGVWALRAGSVGERAAGFSVAVIGVSGTVLVCGVGLILLAIATLGVSLARGVESGARALAGVRSAARSVGGHVRGWRAARRETLALRAQASDDRTPDRVTSPEQAPEPGPDPDRDAPPVAGSAKTASAAGWRKSRTGSFLPPLDLLQAPVVRGEQQDQRALARLGDVLIEKLRSFQVEGEVTATHSGPVLTQFEVEPAPGVKVNQIANLADDLALAMRAQRIRIVAPIPGRGAVGIEVPNPEPQTVTIREILESSAWSGADGKLPLALGREITGSPVVTDLARMPHLLIAGATGSGKSVCINSIVTSLLYRYGPDEVRMIMIDPKMLELIAYNGIPHLLHPVVVEHRHAAKALKWSVAEMDRRYRLLAANGVRSLQDFNTRVAAGDELKLLDDEEPVRPLPYIVVLIDELADLMLTVQNEIEESLARLAQMARAIGIHLVLATQRPSVNVITGVIKANFPSRISFQVSSKIDSRTVIDMNGAEQLLGQGDMLYLPADRAEPVRIQGAFVSTDETNAIVAYLREAAVALDAETIAPSVDIIAETDEAEIVAFDERDELFFAAARVVVEYDQGSTSLIQRRLRVGYSRAARILDQLEQAGIVGRPDGTKARDVLISSMELDQMEQNAR